MSIDAAPKIRVRSIHELLSERLHIPSYQRGYRWTEAQVRALLDDISAFRRGPVRSPGAFYCLQPVVVRWNSDVAAWDLVDGQQRLTTIFLVMQALRDVAEMLKRSCYTITYASRNASAEILVAPTEAHAQDDIDGYHMFHAARVIRTWFEEHDGAERLKLLECLTDQSGNGPNVRVIWYELASGEDPVKAFVRLNVGRLPLTSAELIRALFLRSDTSALDPRDRQQVPLDWDQIERRLQDDRYWYFLQSEGTAPPSRIEYLFELFVRAELGDVDAVEGLDELATFLACQRLILAKDGNAGAIWRDFKRLTQTLEDWFDDRTLFHLVGFLVASAPERVGRRARATEARLLLELLGQRRTSTAREFDRVLRRMAWRRFLGLRSDAFRSDDVPGDAKVLAEKIAERIDGLSYGANSAQVRTSLLLFNVAGLLEQEGDTQRFQFDGYHKNVWDIEHVRSSAEYVPRAAADRRSWLEHARDFVVSPAALALDRTLAEELQGRIDELLATSAPEEMAFGEVFAKVRALSREEATRVGDDALSNLVLLDMKTNRSYKNAIFPVKRVEIIRLDKQGQFVPPATRNVFLKYYSPDADQLLLWDEADQDAYARAIEETLTRFFMPIVEAS